MKKNYQEKCSGLKEVVPQEHLVHFELLFKRFEKFVTDDVYCTQVMDTLFQDMENEPTMSHNDTSQNNILKVKIPGSDKRELQLIDFDGANIAFAGCDIGAIFRATGINYATFGDVPEKLWNEQQQLHFIRAYLTKLHSLSNSTLELEEYLQEQAPKLMQSARRGMAVYILFWMLMCLAPTGLVMYQFLGFHRVKDHLKRMDTFDEIVSNFL